MNDPIATSSALSGFEFILPKGLVDASGNVHRQGLIRPATARDEIEAANHPLVADYPVYQVLVLLSRTILQLGDRTHMAPEMLEHLFLPDLDYLVEAYNAINPREAELVWSGESLATP
ncbi:hypothetical protein [Roseofilum casamattae]|uniref:Phage tail assembly protein n=1 Tax=Roseofilum casamattae BLCC-M143 TaxID=3022442 RepID=A0ABT7BX38_9CYAN|nr:hypothetical protein [Roseofilum casamattae]MDJ1183759.1 phage tail assembly protein [Roseofilum casamattae BLCC-M143]